MSAENIMTLILEEAMKIASFYEHMADMPGLDPAIADSLRSIAKRLRKAIETAKDTNNPEDYKKICRFLGLTELLERFERELERSASNDRGLGR